MAIKNQAMKLRNGRRLFKRENNSCFLSLEEKQALAKLKKKGDRKRGLL